MSLISHSNCVWVDNTQSYIFKLADILLTVAMITSNSVWDIGLLVTVNTSYSNSVCVCVYSKVFLTFVLCPQNGGYAAWSRDKPLELGCVSPVDFMALPLCKVYDAAMAYPCD